MGCLAGLLYRAVSLVYPSRWVFMDASVRSGCNVVGRSAFGQGALHESGAERVAILFIDSSLLRISGLDLLAEPHEKSCCRGGAPNVSSSALHPSSFLESFGHWRCFGTYRYLVPGRSFVALCSYLELATSPYCRTTCIVKGATEW